MTRRPRSTAFQVAVVTAVVAALSTLLTGLIGVNVARQSSDRAVRADLVRDAELLLALSSRDGRPGVLRPDARVARAATGLALVRVLRRQGTSSSVVAPGGAGPTPVPFTVDDVTVTTSTGALSARRRSDGEVWLIEGRTGEDGTVVLVARTGSSIAAITGLSRRALLLPLGVGLVGGVLAGALLARSVSRPLVDLAAVARRISGGERAVAVPDRGTAEVADVAAALRQLDAALVASESAQRELLLAASHELRTPLTAVRGYADALADGTISGDAVPEAARTIVRESVRLNARVADLLALARLDTGELPFSWVESDLVAVLAATTQAWRTRAEAQRVSIRVDLPGDGSPAPVTVRTDPDRLRQAVDALVDNALRLTPPDGVVVLALRTGEYGTQVEVRDSGPGLADADYPVAFQRGVLQQRYRGRRAVGSGVGLALVAGIAGRLGGRAEAEPAREGGACFRIVLPTR